MKSWLFTVHLGRYSYVAGAKIGSTTIGSFCSIGPGALVGGLGSHPLGYISTHPAFFSTKNQSGVSFTTQDLFKESKHTSIANDVWIGARAIVLDGVSIGNGAVVAANAVVTKNVEPFAVVAGIPARVIKYRFQPEVIECLLEWKWWNLPSAVLQSLSTDFSEMKDWTVADMRRLISKSREV